MTMKSDVYKFYFNIHAVDHMSFYYGFYSFPRIMVYSLPFIVFFYWFKFDIFIVDSTL